MHSFPQDVLSTSDRNLIELEKQVKRLMEAHLTPKSPVQVNKIASSCQIFSSAHETQYCMENPEKYFVDYASSCNNEAKGKPFTTNLGPINFNEATNAWKDKPNFDRARTQTFTSLQKGSFSTYSSNMPHRPSNYQSKHEGVLFDFDSRQEKTLSSLGAQLKQKQDEIINKINTLWKVVSDKINNAPICDIAKSPVAHMNVMSYDHRENGAPLNKGIKSPSKLLSLKYQSQSSIESMEILGFVGNNIDPRVYVVDGRPLKSILNKPKESSIVPVKDGCVRTDFADRNQPVEVAVGSGYQQKDRKPSQNDKTEHGMEKTVKIKANVQKSKSESILKNQQSNRSGTEEY
ncbi:hypothetical protein Tco_0500875 [Tanacetum coccineum]